ncbi:MAG: FAD/NAD(P)-binding protein [Gaiellaceae bacterium]
MAVSAELEAHPDAGAMVPEPYRVTRRRRETADTWTLELEPVDGEPLRAKPGQFTMLYAFGVGEAPISICGDLDGGGPLVHTVRAVGQVTKAICASAPGSVLGVRGPFGSTWPVEEAKGGDVVIVAGGIGLPPVRPVFYHVLNHRNDYDRVMLLYGARNPGELVYRREVESWRARFDVEVDVTVDTAPSSWRGNVGLVTRLIPRAEFDPTNAMAFVVGPEIMMKFVALELVKHGMPAEKVALSMERTMRCGVGLCGHCQLGPTLICRDGPCYRWPEMQLLMEVREL